MPSAQCGRRWRSSAGWRTSTPGTRQRASRNYRRASALSLGPVVVELTGEVFGDAPNIAARVQAAADPGSVLITTNVHRQVAGLFVVEEQGARELKGVSEPVQLFRIVRASGGGRRGGARTLTPFVAREEELGTLARRWDRARAGEGQLVLIVGEPGLGKSRLIEEFHSRLTETPHTWSEWSASQLLQNTPLHPIAEWGRQRFGADAPAEQRLADLEDTLRLINLDPVEHAPLLAPLVDIPLPTDRAANFPPEELRRRQLAAMTSWVLAGARSQPVVLAFEDLHWADPTSLDLLRAMAERGAQAPLLVLATTRPEFRAPWSLRSHHSLISLSPLDRTGVARMVDEISARHALSKELIEGVNERTGGVPLFVEEVTRLLVERGEQGGAQVIPPTLQQSLAARLDRLGPAREVAQIGAVLGRDFVYTLLREVAGLDESALQPALELLTEADLLFVEGAPPQANYRFKHALIQDAAYESLLKSRRQVLHRRAAEALLNANAEPEAIAHHFTEACLDDPAIEWWGKAGDQAVRRSAFQEAIAHLGKAIAMADKAAGAVAPHGAGEPAALSQRLKLQTDFGWTVAWSKGYAAEETREAYTRAAELAANTDDFSERFLADYGQWAGRSFRGEHQEAEAIAGNLLHEAEMAKRGLELARARNALGISCLYQGKLSMAQSAFEHALADLSSVPESVQPLQPWIDPGVMAASHLANVAWLAGDPARARRLSDQAIERVTELRHAQTSTQAYVLRSLLETFCDNAAAVLRWSELAIGSAREHGMELYAAFGEVRSAWARGRLRLPQAGAAELRRAIADYVKLGNKIGLPFVLGQMAECEADAQDVDAATATINEALVRASETSERCADGFLHRVRGDILLKGAPAKPALAEGAYKTAIAIAREQGARSFELRAALSLAKLYRSTGRLADAHAVLAPALEGFTPSPEMPEIAEAQALLAALADTEEVKAAEAQRERRLHLQTTYGQAMMMAKGFAAEETRAAFARAAKLAGRIDDFSERFTVLAGQAAAAMTGGELRSACELALTVLREAEETRRIGEAGLANQWLGLIAYWRGDFLEARKHFERAVAARDPNPNLKLLAGEPSLFAVSQSAPTAWALGDLQRARELINKGAQRAAETGHIGGIVDALFFRSYLEVWRDDPVATLSAAEALELVAREHGVAQYLNESELLSGWARGRMKDPMAGAAQMRRVLSAFADQGVKVNLGFYTGLLAQLEAETVGADSALARIDEAFRLSDQVEHRCSLPFLHRLRGELLLKRHPPDTALAEEAFVASIAIAKEQGARSPVLLASLSLAKLYQSTGRALDALAVLAPALEGFAPTDEMPEIAEAQALLVAIEPGAHVRPE